jgi:hypothetical protein
MGRRLGVYDWPDCGEAGVDFPPIIAAAAATIGVRIQRAAVVISYTLSRSTATFTVRPRRASNAAARMGSLVFKFVAGPALVY